VFGFTSKGASPPQVQVGSVGLRAFAWLADETVAPETSEAKLLDEVRDWINMDA